MFVRPFDRRPLLLPLLIVSGLAVGACGSGPVGSPGQSLLPTPGATNVVTPPPTAPATALEAAQADLDTLLEELERIHPEPFHGIPRADWVAELTELREGLGALSPEAAVVELQRVVALLSRAGRDGHQLALPIPGSERPVLPIRIYEFDDGVFITGALQAGQADLVGSRLETVNGHSIEDVLAAVEPLVPRDGPSTVPLFRPVLALRTEVLQGLGLIDEGPVSIRVSKDGTTRDVTLQPVPFDDYRSWAGDFGMFRLAERPSLAYVADLDTISSWRVLPDGETLYLRYTQIRGIESTVLREITERVKAGGIERVVVDLRQNPGGDNTNNSPVVAMLNDPAIDVEGRLYVLTDHVTFSAAANLATAIEQSTSAIFAGEAPGGGLNFWNDVRWVRLPHYPIPMQVGVSTRYWQLATPDDPRLTIDPDIPVPNLAVDYFADRDPVLDAVLDRPIPGAT